MIVYCIDNEITTRGQDMENTYWANKGKYQKDYDRLLELMPIMGNSDKVAGELIRAVSKLGYELYNNGMGNNSSGAVNMLRAYGVINGDTYETIYPMTKGRTYNGNYNGDSFQLAIESSIDQTIKHILDNPKLESQDNSVDMFTYEDDEDEFCEECGDELGDSMNGYSCLDCDEHYEDD